jgi:hypothetical protein
MRKNLNPHVWGPGAWQFLQNCAEAADEDCADKYVQFINLLQDVLPCEKCREHCAQYINDNPVDPNNLKDWLLNFQQHVEQTKKCDNSCQLPKQQWKLKYTHIFIMSLLIVLCLFFVANSI